MIVVEWAPGFCLAQDPESSQVFRGQTLTDLQAQLAGQEVLISISRRASFLRSIRLPDVAKPEMAKILMVQLPNLFPLGAQELSYDFAPQNDLNGEGRLVVVAAVATQALRQVLDEAHQAGLRVESVVPSASSAMSLGIDRGVIVSKSDTHWEFEVLEHGTPVLSRSVAGLESVAEVQKEIERTLASSGMATSEVFCFEGAELPEATRLDSTQIQSLLLNSTVFRLELPEVKAKREAKQSQHWKNIAMLLSVATFGVVAIVWDIRSDVQGVVNKGEQKWQKVLSNLKSDNSQAQTKASEIRNQKRVVSTAFEPKQPFGDVLSVFTNLTPNNVWLTGVSIERGKRATLRGTALSGQLVTSYLSGLAQQSRLRDVKLVFANDGQINKTAVVNFSISCHVVGNFPIPDDKELNKK